MTISEFQEDFQTCDFHTDTVGDVYIGGEGYFRVPIYGCRNKGESRAPGLLEHIVPFRKGGD